ncbi:hypothetical protein A2U01_0090072, partial [Trifolium medium]|nr:hypothetical protein [Trifolium medium]
TTMGSCNAGGAAPLSCGSGGREGLGGHVLTGGGKSTTRQLDF